MPVSYACSNSGRLRTRDPRFSPHAFIGANRPCARESPFVGDSQPLAALRTSTRQNDAAVLRRHTDTKPMRLCTAPGVGLICTFTLHGGLEPSRSARCRIQSHSTCSWTSPAARRNRNDTRSNFPVSNHHHPVRYLGIVVRAVVLQSPLPPSAGQLPRANWVSSPRFPQLWKTLLKSLFRGPVQPVVSLFLTPPQRSPTADSAADVIPSHSFAFSAKTSESSKYSGVFQYGR